MSLQLMSERATDPKEKEEWKRIEAMVRGEKMKIVAHPARGVVLLNGARIQVIPIAAMNAIRAGVLDEHEFLGKTEGFASSLADFLDAHGIPRYAVEVLT